MVEKINMAIANQGYSRGTPQFPPRHNVGCSHDAAAPERSGEVKVEKKIAKIKFNADAMTLNDPVQRKSQMNAIFLSSKVVYFEVP
jgi:hypothetical protein